MYLHSMSEIAICGQVFALLCYARQNDGEKMMVQRIAWYILVVIGFFWTSLVSADPIYVNNYLLQGDVVGTVVSIAPTVKVDAEKTTIDMREWLPSLQNPLLQAETTYQFSTTQPEQFGLFTLTSSAEPKIRLNQETLSPAIAQYPQQKVFYDNSFRGINTKDTPLGAMLAKENIVGFSIPIQSLPVGKSQLQIEQVFDVRVDSSHFTRRYELYVLNPQWQGQMTGLLRAWDVTVEVLVPPSWKVNSKLLFDRQRDVVTFQLDPSQALLHVELVPPHSKNLYKLVKSSLWLLLMIMTVITGVTAYVGAIFVDKTPMPPRVMMLLIVVVCMGIDWLLAKQLTEYLQTEAFLNHLSLMTLQEIQHNHWVHQFYGAILTALVACLVFLRSLEVPFIEKQEIEIIKESTETSDGSDVNPEASVPLAEEIAPPEFTLLNGNLEETEEAPQEFFVMGAVDDETDGDT